MKITTEITINKPMQTVWEIVGINLAALISGPAR